MSPKRKKSSYQVLKSLYGLNTCTVNKIVGLLGLHPQSKNKYFFSTRQRNKTAEILASLRIGFRLRLIIFSRILLQCHLKTYRGIRHIDSLPCRGQRTHANAKTPARLKLQGKHIPFKLIHFKKPFQKLSLTRQKNKNQVKNKNKPKQKNVPVKQKKKNNTC